MNALFFAFISIYESAKIVEIDQYLTDFQSDIHYTLPPFIALH